MLSTTSLTLPDTHYILISGKVSQTESMPTLCRSISLLTETTIKMRITATYGASSVGHQEDAVFGGIKSKSLFLAPPATLLSPAPCCYITLLFQWNSSACYGLNFINILKYIMAPEFRKISV